MPRPSSLAKPRPPHQGIMPLGAGPRRETGSGERRGRRGISGKKFLEATACDPMSRPSLGTESQAAAFIRARIAKGTVVHADEAAAWDHLHERFEVKRFNRQEAYSFDGASTNWAEEYFSRLRRAEIGIHHPIASEIPPPLRPRVIVVGRHPQSLERRSSEKVSNGDQVNRIAALA
jgi:hypothetical protein